jgi:hypothetical protein
MSLVEIRGLYTPVAFTICAHRYRGHIEGVENPHTHPEAPSDKLLSDFFCPVCLHIH